MSGLSLVVSARKGQWQEAMAAKANRIAKAATGAMRETAESVKKKGRAEIGRAGFGSKWQNALRVTIYPDRGESIDVAAYIFHKIPYAGVFETGATIKGSPLLWLPLPAAPLKVGGRRVTAGNYRELIGAPLHSINRPGRAPVLAAYVAGAPKDGKRATAAQLKRGVRNARRAQANAAFGGKAGRFGVVSLPLYVGVPRAHLRARFGLKKIFRDAHRALRRAYQKQLSAAR